MVNFCHFLPFLSPFGTSSYVLNSVDDNGVADFYISNDFSPTNCGPFTVKNSEDIAVTDARCDCELEQSEKPDFPKTLSCQIENYQGLLPGTYTIDDEEFTILAPDVNEAEGIITGRHRCSNRYRNNLCEDTGLRSRFNDDFPGWLPQLKEVLPSEVSTNGGVRITVKGYDLIPEQLKAMSEDFVKIFMVSQADPEVKFECELITFWSSDELLYCISPEIPRDFHGIRFNFRFSFFDGQAMVPAEEINPLFYQSSECYYSHWRKLCSTEVYDENRSMRGARKQLFGNRHVSGLDTKVTWTNWYNVQPRQDGDNNHHSSSNPLKSFYIYHRNEICDFPIKVETRRVSDKVNVENIPELVIKKHTVWHGFIVEQDQQAANYTLEEFETRFLCDSNVVQVQGNFRSQRAPEMNDPTKGMTIPYLASVYDKTAKVATCALKYQSDEYELEYPHNIGSGLDRNQLRCHLESSSEFHGPTNFTVRNTHKYGEWFVDSGTVSGDTTYLTNDMDASYEIRCSIYHWIFTR